MMIPRLMISSCGSGSGKTTVTMALLSAFLKKNISVQSFKCGADYIDPMFHSKITGKAAYHTDPFFSDKEQLKYIIAKASENSSFALIEGAMGFYDGIGTSSECSAYSVAEATETPVLLVINPGGMGCSVGAFCRGFLEYRENNHISGVIFNRIRPEMYNYYCRIIEENTDLKVYGFLPDIENITFKSRHLGLLTPDEIENFNQISEVLGKTALETIDFDGIIKLSKTAPPLIYKPVPDNFFKRVRLGIAMDEAFCFYYQENLEMLKRFGAEIVRFSPIYDSSLPDDLDGIYFGGGYPELFADKLSKNISFIESLRKQAENGIPVFAECGGFIYLQEKIINNNKYYNMANLLSGVSHMENHLVRFGYVNLKAKQDTLLAKKGDILKAHEFHYFDTSDNGNAFEAEKPNGRHWEAIQQNGNIMGGFPHIYFPSCPEAVKRFICFMFEYNQKNKKEGKNYNA